MKQIFKFLAINCINQNLNLFLYLFNHLAKNLYRMLSQFMINFLIILKFALQYHIKIIFSDKLSPAEKDLSTS